jgi:hypothetical protein
MYSYNLTRVFRYSFFKVLCFRWGLVRAYEATLWFTQILTLPQRGTLVGDGGLSSRPIPFGLSFAVIFTTSSSIY